MPYALKTWGSNPAPGATDTSTTKSKKPKPESTPTKPDPLAIHLEPSGRARTYRIESGPNVAGGDFMATHETLDTELRKAFATMGVASGTTVRFSDTATGDVFSVTAP
mgnify:CR=1 FL=1